MSDSVSRAALTAELRRALAHLYDQVALRKSPLIELLGVDHRKEPPLALRRLLTEAIESLKPEPAVPAQAHAWRIYHILSQRYVEQLTQREVATDLGLSIRQLQRQERGALRTLADHLWGNYRLEQATRHSVAPVSHDGSPERAAPVAVPSREQEIAWLRQSLPSEPADLIQVVQSALNVVRPLSESLAVAVDCDLSESLPPLAMQRDSLRQALLIMLTAAIRCAPGGRVRVRAETWRWEERVQIRAVRQGPIASVPSQEHLSTIAVARELVGLSGGTLEVTADEQDPEPFVARLILPTLEQVPVLVVDDHVDTLRLFEHYLARTRYRFIGLRDPQDLWAAVECQIPQAIVLDVMLPRIDGWELLGRLRAHPHTCDVPIIVCTILPQEQLALSLGAAGFLTKPVSRQALLAALDRQLDRLEKGPH